MPYPNLDNGYMDDPGFASGPSLGDVFPHMPAAGNDRRFRGVALLGADRHPELCDMSPLEAFAIADHAPLDFQEKLAALNIQLLFMELAFSAFCLTMSRLSRARRPPSSRIDASPVDGCKEAGPEGQRYAALGCTDDVKRGSITMGVEGVGECSDDPQGLFVLDAFISSSRGRNVPWTGGTDHRWLYPSFGSGTSPQVPGPAGQTALHRDAVKVRQQGQCLRQQLDKPFTHDAAAACIYESAPLTTGTGAIY